MPSNLISLNYKKYGHNQILRNIFKVTARQIYTLIPATSSALNP